MIVFASAIGFLVGLRLGLALFVENSSQSQTSIITETFYGRF